MAPESIYKSLAGQKEIMEVYDSMLARWPVPHESMHLPTRYGDTFVIASGPESAPPLVLIHGAGSNSMTWTGDIADYSLKYRTYTVDLPGEPGKSAPNRPAWDGPAFAEWLEEVFEALKIDKAVLVGFSQGGWTALKFAVFHSQRVEKLVLISPGGIIPDRLGFVVKVLPLSLMGRWGARRVNRILFADQKISPEVEELLILISRFFKPRIGVLPIFSDEELHRLKMPVLLIMGDRDALRDGKKISARLHRFVISLRTTFVPGGGHALLSTSNLVLPFISSPLLWHR